MSLSLRGIARHFLGRTGPIPVREVFFPGDHPVLGLRERATELAQREISFEVAECVYGWTARYEQTWSHVSVRVQLVPDADVTDATITMLQAVWKPTIEARWSNRWSIAFPGEVACPLTFSVEWVPTNAHHAVRVQIGPARSNMTLWDTLDTGAVAAHEFGHMHGKPDEYPDDTCSMRNPVSTGTIMDNNSDTLPDRLVQHLADNVGSNIAAI